MKLNLRRAISSAAVLAIAGGVLSATASIAYAGTTPPWEPDPNALGSLTLYNSAGVAITGGTNLAQLFSYAEASTTDATGGTKSYIEFALPEPSTPTGSFPFSSPSSDTTFPDASAPAPLNTATNPVFAASASTDTDLANFIASTTAQTAAGYANVYQIRLITTGIGGVGTQPNGTYWEVDVLVNPANGTWTEEYPATGVVPTSTVLTAPAATVGVPDTLTATVTPPTAGTVQFENGGTPIGTPQPVNTTTGVATLSYTFTAAGSQSLSAVFTSTATGYSGSTSAAVAVAVNPASTPTTTTLVVTQSGSTGVAIPLSATVVEGPTAPTPGAPVEAGTVSFYDGATLLNATPVTSTTGTYTFTIPATGTGSLGAGGHSIVADFTPTNPANFEASASQAQTFILQAPVVGACSNPQSVCTETQNIEATIPVGTLVISTPYTATSPLNLGSLALNSGLTEYTGNAPFANITVVDTRAGDLPWTVSALASNLTDGGTNLGSTICGQNVGLATLTSTPGAGFAGIVTTDNNYAAGSNGIPIVAPTTPGICPSTAAGLVGAGDTAVTVAEATAGLGTDVINGTLTLDAPVSTEPNVFTGTITFTVG